ncbi:putative ribonuclease H protein [Sesbania bispinosa]|nr:putative ribonuclease H protein [Sesbania bispinosa]
MECFPIRLTSPRRISLRMGLGSSDEPAWKLEPNDEFTLKPAYEFLQEETTDCSPANDAFQRLWKWQGPP